MAYNYRNAIRGAVIVFCVSITYAAPALADSTRQEIVVGAMGDSITRAFSSGGLFDTPRNSWATGSSLRVSSHAAKISALLEVDVAASNVARSGATSRDLERQLNKLLGRHARVDYVTFLIGANDICDWENDYDPQLNTFFERIDGVFSRLVAHNPDIKIVLSPIPDMYHLWQLGREMGCQMKWSLTGFCSALLGKNRTDWERQLFVHKWQAANSALEEIALRYGNNVYFADAAQRIAFEPEHVSRLDCFHPSVEGQRLISEETWLEDWF